MDDQFVFQMLGGARPPFLGPRRRCIDPSVLHTLKSWVCDALERTAHGSIEVAEWVSMDSRAVPHIVLIGVGGAGRGRRSVAIRKASERIVEADIRTALCGLRSNAADAPST